MSAIWGIVDFNKKGLSEADARQMEEVYRSKKIDRIDTFFQLDFYLGCGIQYVNKEAALEQFPYADKDEHYLVADVILDNREELQKFFSTTNELSLKGVDGSILFECVKQDMDRALEQMLGAYAFAFYDRKKGILQLANDAVGNRSVYYCFDKGRVYFSTLLEAITGLQKGLKSNRKWFQNFFEQDNLRVVAEARETPYQGIYRVEPGEIVTFSKEGVERKAYWDPFAKGKMLKLASDEEYKELVCSVFRQCVESIIREGKNMAILLSGGLDSNAVAAYAAPKLKSQGKKLYSFTSVPDKEGKRIPANAYYVEDEREYIEELQKWHDNLEPEYIDASEGEFLAENRKILEILEIPFKTVLNMPWIYKSYQQAAAKECGVILSGQYGNITISYGDFRCLFVTLLQGGKWIRLIKEINAYSKRYKKSRKWILKDLLTATREDNFQNYKQYMYDKIALRQVGETEVKFSLDTGVIPRDPTRDKRLIELVLSLPLEQFVRYGHERRLVREYMKDVIPEKIVGDEFHRGRQGVGSQKRMQKQWEQIIPELQKAFDVPVAGEYLDVAAAKEKLHNRDMLFAPENEFEMMKLVYSGLVCEYLEKKYEV